MARDGKREDLPEPPSGSGLSRRDFFLQSGHGFGALAFAALLASQRRATAGGS